MGSGYVRLGPGDILDDRPFTHPDHSQQDLSALRAMAHTLRERVSRLARLPWHHPQPLLCYLREGEGRQHRVIVVDPGELMGGHGFTVVGFFGQKRADADVAVLGGIDSELIAEVMSHPLLLSYSSLELRSGNWANLVLLRHREGIDNWSASQRHAYASQVLAPGYYAGIRLHNGELPEGLRAIDQLRLLRTKYYDYRDDSIPWRAVREVHAPPYKAVLDAAETIQAALPAS
jgi:hypothetical protein